jgi:hypothetical protein
MDSGSDGKGFAKTGNRSMSDYGMRAGFAITRLVPGPHRDKILARIFGCSDRMVRYLRAGQHWTTDRLSLASAKIQGFDEAISTPNLHHRLDEIQQEINEIRYNLRGESGE